MDNGVYITLSRQLALFRDMDTTANNIANMNTSGYNANHVLFTSYLVPDAKHTTMNFTHDISTWRDTTPGGTHVTGNTFDLALGGEGYFMVGTPLGNRYTRAGNFELNSEGTLVTPEGYTVLDQNGQQITFDPEDRNIVIGSAGNISVSGEERATIAVVGFENPQTLERRGERMLASEETPTALEAPNVMQGILENSNVQPVSEVTHMMEVSRAVGSTAKLIETIYDLQRKSTNTWTQQS